MFTFARFLLKNLVLVALCLHPLQAVVRGGKILRAETSRRKSTTPSAKTATALNKAITNKADTTPPQPEGTTVASAAPSPRPAILPAAAPATTCGANERLVTFDWNSVTYTPGSLGPVTYSDLGGTGINLTFQGTDPSGIKSAGTPLTATGFSNTGVRYLYLGMNASNAGQYQTMKLTFNRPVSNVSFSTYDVDTGPSATPSSWVDRFTVTGLNGSTSITPTFTPVSPGNYSIAGNVVTAVPMWNIPNNSNAGDVATSFASAVNSITIQYEAGPNSDADPITQNIGVFANLSFCTPLPVVTGYKSVKLTTDADGSGTPSPGDTLTYTVSYINTGSGNATSFQINDPLPSNVTKSGSLGLTTSGADTTATVNGSYTGSASGTVSNLLASGAILAAGGVITVTIPVTVNAGFYGTLNNQATATSTGLSTSVLTDNVGQTADLPSAAQATPYNLTVPSGSIAQTQTSGTDATVAVSAPPSVTIAGTVWQDADNSANGTFTNIKTGTETSTNAGGTLQAILVAASGLVLATTPVSSNGTYSFTGVSINQANVTIRLSTAAGTVGQSAPSVAVPTGWTNTSPLLTTAFNIGTSNIGNKDFGVEQLPVAAATNPASQTNVLGTTNVVVPSLHFTGSDADGTITTFKFTTFPTNVTSITINGSQYTAATFPTGGVTVAASGGALPANVVSIDPIDGSVTANIPFTVLDNAGKESSSATVQVAFIALPPNLGLVKSCTTPANCISATQAPGTELTYRIDFTNQGGSQAQQFVLVDPIPDFTDFKLSSAAISLGSTGLTVVVEYSGDYNATSPGSATWTYTPSSGSGGAASGYDRNVKAVRWRVTAGNLSFTSPDNTGNVSFTVKIR